MTTQSLLMSSYCIVHIVCLVASANLTIYALEIVNMIFAVRNIEILISTLFPFISFLAKRRDSRCFFFGIKKKSCFESQLLSKVKLHNNIGYWRNFKIFRHIVVCDRCMRTYDDVWILTYDDDHHHQHYYSSFRCCCCLANGNRLHENDIESSVKSRNEIQWSSFNTMMFQKNRNAVGIAPTAINQHGNCYAFVNRLVVSNNLDRNTSNII